MFDKKLSFLLVLFVLIFITTSYLSISNNRMPFFTRASESEVDITKTLLIANKFQALADNNDYIEFNVFVRNTNGKTLENKPVTINSSLGNFNKTSALTDNYGKASFMLKSSETGKASINALVESIPVKNTVVVKFENK